MLAEYCTQKLAELGLDDDAHKKRLRWELDDARGQDKESLLWGLRESKTRFASNPKNLLTLYLLGVVEHFDIGRPPACVFGESPDIDVDYVKPVRAYLKNVWAPKTFGQEYVCNIGSYGTFGLKSSFIDMARVHDLDKEHVMKLTKGLDAKDEEGKTLTFDAALRLYPELKKYCDANPQVAQATQKILNRNRQMGVHAGGLIISSVPLSDFVPLVRNKDEPQASAWVEGLHGQDLQPVGLVKFDLLVISGLIQIAKAAHLVKQRKGVAGIFNLPGLPDWSDTDAWRDNKEALAAADAGDLRCIFQFDASDGIREMVRSSGVTRFEDLVALTALWRPGPLGAAMHTRYIERKRGREKYELHPLMQAILGKSYGVMVFQEDVMKILHAVGEIPLKDCEAVRKAISKKKEEQFKKYEGVFILNGAKNLGSEAAARELWRQILTFAEYGFSKNHAVPYTYISMWQLNLKVHYPHEFFAAILSCEKDSDKIKEYRNEARAHGVKVLPLHLNNSKAEFSLAGDDIYFGFQHVKGIGRAAAQKIESLQPYSGIEDFLHRFGTASGVLKPLISLGVFGDDVHKIWAFAEAYRDWQKKQVSAAKRQAESAAARQAEYESLTGRSDKLEETGGFDRPEWRAFDVEFQDGEIDEYVPADEADHDVAEENEDGSVCYYKIIKKPRIINKLKRLKHLWRAYWKSLSKGPVPPPRWETFGDWARYNLPEGMDDRPACETLYYGFPWVSALEASPDFKPGYTFEALKGSPEVKPVFMEILKVSKRTGKKTSYYQLEASDESGEVAKVNVWMDDWERWGEKLQKGNLVSARLRGPSGGFPSFALDGVPRWQKWKRPSKEDDFRVQVLSRAENPAAKCQEMLDGMKDLKIV